MATSSTTTKSCGLCILLGLLEIRYFNIYDRLQYMHVHTTDCLISHKMLNFSSLSWKLQYILKFCTQKKLHTEFHCGSPLLYINKIITHHFALLFKVVDDISTAFECLHLPSLVLSFSFFPPFLEI